jgi:arginyl-tRNA synthetase
MCSIFKKAGTFDLEKSNLELLKTKEELDLIRLLIQFPALIQEVAQNLEVNGLVNFAIELSNKFHKFYEANMVISEDKELTSSRLYLLRATQITLKNTLDLLGVTATEEM